MSRASDPLVDSENSLSRLRVEPGLSMCCRQRESGSIAADSVRGFTRQNWSLATEVATSPLTMVGSPYTIASYCFADQMRQS